MNNFKKVLFLGPKGSYSDAAKEKFKELFSETFETFENSSITGIINSLLAETSAETVAILPLENSIEGIVRETQDKLDLMANNGIYVYAETNLSVEHCLVGYTDNKSEIKKVSSHPQALAQCRGYLYNNLKDVIFESAFSTSSAVSSLLKENSSNVAIGSEFCANIYGVPIIEKNINDEENNTTRFILLSRVIPARKDKNKILITFSTENKVGALTQALSILESYGINLSYIDSRPSRKELGEYVFYADFEGHVDDNNIMLALTELQQSVRTLTVLSKGAIIL